MLSPIEKNVVDAEIDVQVGGIEARGTCPALAADEQHQHAGYAFVSPVAGEQAV